MKRDLTDKQYDILVFMREFLLEEDRMPSSWEIQRKFGWASQTAAMSHLRALAKKGYIEHRHNLRNNRGWYRLTRY